MSDSRTQLESLEDPLQEEPNSLLVSDEIQEVKNETETYTERYKAKDTVTEADAEVDEEADAETDTDADAETVQTSTDDFSKEIDSQGTTFEKTDTVTMTANNLPNTDPNHMNNAVNLQPPIWPMKHYWNAQEDIANEHVPDMRDPETGEIIDLGPMFREALARAIERNSNPGMAVLSYFQ